jgi:hypothetical protein
MLDMKNLSRRTFLDSGKKILAFIPFVNIIGCIPDQSLKLSPEDSLRKLIHVIGPWTLEEKPIAEDFSNRFLQANHIVSQYLPASADIIQKLSSRFSNDDFAVKEIDLIELSSKEQDLIKILGMQIYDLIEVRFYVSEIPPWGQCIGDPYWHTKVLN